MNATHKCLAMVGMLLAMGTACNAAVDAAPAAGTTVEQQAATTEVVDELPLKRGLYVRSDDTCATASNATTALVKRKGITGCEFKRIERIDESRYRVQESCHDPRAPAPSTDEVTNEYEVLAEDRYRVTYEYGESADFSFCPQESMAEHWRDNDISDLID